MRVGPRVKAALLWLAFVTAAPAWADKGDPRKFDALWNFQDARESEKRFRKLLQEKKLTESVEWVLELKTQVARALGLQRRFEAAHELLDLVKPAVGEAYSRAEVRYLLERGRLYYLEDKAALGRPLFKRAYDLAQEEGYAYFAVDAAHMLGIVEPSRAGRREWKETARARADKAGGSVALSWLGTLYHDLAWEEHDDRQFEAALALFQKSREWMAKKDDAEGERTARWCAAKMQRLLGRTHEALRAEERLERDYRKVPNGFVFEELAELHLKLGERARARTYFAKAYERLSLDPWMVRDQAARLARIKALGEGKPEPKPESEPEPKAEG